MRTRVTPALAALLVCAVLAGAQDSRGAASLREAVEYFGQGQYSHAIVLLRSLALDPEETEHKAEAYYWLAKSYLALESLEDAERTLEFYLKNYPSDERYPEAFYEKGRLLFRQGDHESAIQALQSFLERYGDSEYVPNAYFWIGESLYSLGQLDDALLVFRKVVDSYPKSFKVEAARYRISIIEFKKRENELLKLLKWSHEESLKTVEGFQRREVAYEQALAAYQRRLAEFEQADYQKLVQELRGSLAQKEAQIASTTAQLEQAQKEIERLEQAAAEAAAAATAAAAAGEAAPPAPVEQTEAERNRALLLDLKAEALEVKEAILGWMLAQSQER